MKQRLLIVTSHPIQYHAPWFRALHADGRIELEVLFLTLPDAQDQGVGFGQAFEWDVPLLEGYPWRQAESAQGGITGNYFSLRLRRPAADLDANRYNAILVLGWHKYGMLQCLKAAQHSGTPVLVRAESNGLAPITWPRRTKAKWILKNVRAFLAIGKANRLFYEQIGLSGRVVTTVPYFVDNQYFASRADALRNERSNLRQRYGIPEAATCFLFAGKFVPKKRPDDILAALKLVTSRGSDEVHLLMVGSGELEQELRQKVAESALPVSFAGFFNQSEMPAAYAAADCLVLPSDFGETWGLVVNEAMACGVPAIVSDRVGCSLDLVKNGVTGYRFQFGDGHALAHCMEQVSRQNTDDRCEMQEAVRKILDATYTVEQACEETLRGVLSVVNGD